MIIKKFTAPTMTEALSKVREELGNDAIILNTRSEKKGGVLDFIGRSVVEVTAAVDDNPPAGRGANLRTAGMERRTQPIGPEEAGLYPPGQSNLYTPPGRIAIPKDAGEVSIKELGDRVQVDRIMDDIKELKSSIRDLADSALTGELDGLPTQLAALLKRMLDSGIDEKISKRLIRQLLHDLNGNELSAYSVIVEKATNMLAAGMGEVSPIIFAGARPRIVSFIGPTGSGKTTTIAKLATEFSLNMDKKVSVLTIDTKRVDAVGQLKAYCRIINIPLFIVYSPDEIPGIMPGIMDSDITLVDTPGSGPVDRKQMLEMVEFLQKLVPQEVHLTMSVTTSLIEMKRIFKGFGVMKPNRILFTKLDESSDYGTMLSFALISKKPLSYVTFGQNVPGDFSVADTRSLIRDTLEVKKASS